MTNKSHRIDWLNHALEFFVVIIGILIAFQLNKCSSDRSQSQVIKTHLSQIVEETQFNKHSLESSIAYAENMMSKFDTIFTLIASKEDFRRVNQLSIDLLNLGGVYIRKTSYLLLTETGDFRYMKNFEKKQSIIDLYEYYKWVESFDQISITLHSSDFYPYVKANFDLIGNSIQADEVYESKLFKNILGAYYRTSQNRLKKYKDCLKEIDAYLERVKE